MVFDDEAGLWWENSKFLKFINLDQKIKKDVKWTQMATFHFPKANTSNSWVYRLFSSHMFFSQTLKKKDDLKKGDPLEDSNYRDMVHNG